MGFIERLRSQQKAEALVRSQREAELRRKKEAEEEAWQQRKAQERAFHEKRSQEATSFWQKSGVEILLSELRKILQDSGALDASSDPDFRTKFYSAGGFLHDKLKKDSDSTSSPVFWDRRVIGQGTGASSKWDECEGKFLVAEVLPEGNIIFHAKKDVIVPVTRWRDDRAIIENSLEIAFNNPGFNKFTGNYREYNSGQ